MLRLLAFVGLALLVELPAAYAQTPPKRTHKASAAAKVAPAPAPAPPASPDMPDPVTWMGQAVDHILSGVIPPPPAPPTQGQ